jgi:hypothetical protein
MKTYKLYRRTLGGKFDTFFYDELPTAKRVYNRMKNEKPTAYKTRWAELVETDWDGDEDEGDKVVCGFEREVTSIFGIRFIDVAKEY